MSTEPTVDTPTVEPTNEEVVETLNESAHDAQQDIPELKIRTSARKGLADSALGTRNLMIEAALGVVSMVLILPLTYAAPGVVGVSAQAILVGVSIMGLWVIPYLIPAVVVKRPGATIVSALVMALIAVFTTPQGVSSIFGHVMGALFIEIPLACMLYKKWNTPRFIIAAAVFGALNGSLYLMALTTSTPILYKVAVIGISVASAAIGGYVCVLLNQLINKAGIAVDRQN